jgi:competence protein ComEA
MSDLAPLIPPSPAQGPTQSGTPAPSSAATSSGSAPQTILGLTRSDTFFALVVGSIVLALTLAHWFRLTLRGAPPVEIDRLPASVYEFQVDINHATWVEWMQLEGIGEITARRIVADREQRGPFAGVADLDRVPGIGPKTLAAIRPFLRCTDCDPPAGKQP